MRQSWEYCVDYTLEALHYVDVLGILIELNQQDEFISQALIQFSLRASDAKGNQQLICQVSTTGDVLGWEEDTRMSERPDVTLVFAEKER